jgi:transposase-like protein
MVRPGRERLSSRVEADETYLGGLEEGRRGRQTESKALIAVAAEEDGKGIGRIRMRRIPDASARSLLKSVQESVEPGSVIHTDGWLGYEPVQAEVYKHRITFPTWTGKIAFGTTAACASRGIPAQAMIVGHASRGGEL